jgi:predicted transposase
MKLVLKLKMRTDDQTDRLLRETTRQYWQVCNLLSEIAFEHKSFSRYALQHIAYHQVKARLPLPSQLIVRALAEVCSSYKVLIAQIKEHNRTCERAERRELQASRIWPSPMTRDC